jgi:hypothetical protein
MLLCTPKEYQLHKLFGIEQDEMKIINAELERMLRFEVLVAINIYTVIYGGVLHVDGCQHSVGN